MDIAVRPPKIAAPDHNPDYLEQSLEEFFVTNTLAFQESPNFPFEREGREGGCQFAFD